MSIIYCPVCGKNIKYRGNCTRCGYEKNKDYEAYPTISKIKKRIKNVEQKRQDYENKRFASRYNEFAHSINADMAKQKQELFNLQAKYNKLEEQNHILEKQLREEHQGLLDLQTKYSKFEEQKHIMEKQLGEIQKQLTKPVKQSANRPEEIQKSNNLSNENKKQNASIVNRAKTVEKQLSQPVEKQKSLKIGDSFYFGLYKQDAKGNKKKPIEWIILDKIGNKYLLISKYALDCKPYNDKNEGTTWEKCSLRTWLNSGFIADAFRSQELGRIVETKVTADKDPKYNTNPGNDTNDKVFLLSIKEAEKYFSSNEARQCKPTEYAIENNALVNNKGNCWWWLRSPGYYDIGAAEVNVDGYVNYSGFFVDYDISAVRPALWINLLS